MPPFNLWTVAAVWAFFALLATIRLSSVSWSERKLSGVMQLFFSPIWLTPLVFVLAWTIGLTITGAISTWPPHAFEQGKAIGGYWGGVTVFLMIIIAELWLLWTGSQIALRYSPPEKRAQIKYLPLLGMALAGGFLFWMWTIHH